MSRREPRRADETALVRIPGATRLAPTRQFAEVQPTQLRRPWRTTVRGLVQGLLAFAVIAPLIVEAAGIDVAGVPFVATGLAVLAGLVRVMALPQVEVFLRRFVPWLAAGAR